MFQPATSGCRAGDINGARTLLEVLDDAAGVDDECSPIGDSAVGHQHAVIGGGLPHEVAQHGEFDVFFFSPVTQGGKVVGADHEHFSSGILELLDTSLVSAKFLRSTTGEGGGKECQDDILFAAKLRELHWLASG